MDQKIIKQWDKNKADFKFLIKRAIVKNNFVYEYKYLLSLLIQYVINKNLDEEEELNYELDRIIEITLGGWNGEYLYIITPKNVRFPSVSELWMTKVYFGSCAGCDMLLAAESNVKEANEKVDIIMNLSLNLIQEFKPLSILYPV